MSRWKIFDNLRRSLVPLALTLLLLLGWTVLVAGLVLDAGGDRHRPCSALIASLLELLRKPDDVLLGQHLAAASRSAGGILAQALFTLACLPYEAFFSLDAIVRTTDAHAVTRSGCWNGRRRAMRIEARAPTSSSLVPVDVDRRLCRYRDRGSLSGIGKTGRA